MNNHQPLISIIVPIYKVEKYLHKCLDSIVNQTLKDIEIILVDDGSPDNCPHICDEYAAKDKRIKVIHNVNGGYGKAVNSGLDIATGEYIGIVESDDWIDTTMYEKLYNQAKATNADITKASFYFIRNEKKDIKEVFVPWLKLAPKGELFKLEDKVELLRQHSSLWSAIYNHDFLKKNHIRLQETPGASYQDWPFVVSVYSVADAITMLPEPLLFYRDETDNHNSSSHNGGKNMIKIIDQAECARDILIKNKRYYGDLKSSYGEQAFRVSELFINRIAYEFKEEFFQRLKKLAQTLVADNISFKFYDSFTKFLFNAALMSDSYEEYQNCKNNYIPSTSKMTLKLFNFLPLMKIKSKNNIIKMYLFNFIPFLKLKKK